MPRKDIFEPGYQLCDAVQDDNLARVKELVGQGVSANFNQGLAPPPLLSAVGRGNRKMVGFLLAHGADPNVVRKDREDSNTILIAATGKGNKDIVELLIAAGADVDAANGAGATALHIAAMQGFCEVARLLVAGGARLDVFDNEGETPLMLATHRQKWKMARMLACAGADVNARDNSSRTPLHWATGDSGTLQVLTGRNAIVDARDKWDQTPLHFAAEGKFVKSLEILVAAGADVDICNYNAQTPADIFPGLKKIIEKYAAENAPRRQAALIREQRERMRRIAPKSGPRL